MHRGYISIGVILITVIFLISNISSGINLKETMYTNDVLDVEDKDWWPMFQHDPANNGFSTSIGPTTNKTLWIFHSPGKTNAISVFNNKIYFGTNKIGSSPLSESYIYCIDFNGQEIWRFRGINNFYSTPLIYDDKLFIGNDNGKIFCLNADTGELIWNKSIGNEDLSSFTVSNGKLVITSTNGYVYCINSEDGKLIWSYGTGMELVASPAIVDNRVYIGNYCFDLNDGTRLWRSEVGFPFLSSPTVYDGKVFVGAINELMYCVNASDGREVWDHYIGSMHWNNCPSIAYGNVYVATKFGFLYCINIEENYEIWTIKYSPRPLTSPAICDGKIYIGSFDKHIYCIDAFSGELIWKYKTDETIDISPVIADGKVFASSGNNLYCFGAEEPTPDLDCNGTINWNNIKPGSLIKDNFTLRNIGEDNSKLDWRIQSYPEWGNWSFSIMEGNDLKPSDGWINIEVYINTSDMQKGSYCGYIKVINVEDEQDFELIEVSIIIQKNKIIKPFKNIWFFQIFFRNAFNNLIYLNHFI